MKTYPIVNDALRFQASAVNGKSHETRSRARRRLNAALAVMNSKALAQFYKATEASK